MRVGVINVQSIFERSKAGKAALERLTAEFGEQRRRLTDEESALARLAASLDQADGQKSAEQARRETEQYLARLEEYHAQVAAFNQELARRHRALMAEYLAKIQVVAQPIAEREGFVALLHQGRPETSLIVLYRAPEIDLTDRVIEALDREAP